MPRPPDQKTAIRPLLQRLGLDSGECEIYLALLALKTAPASVIAKKAGQQRSNAYLTLQSLEGKGLVSRIERGKILHFVCEAPERILSLIEDRERELKTMKILVEGALPILKSMTHPLVGKPRVTMLSGIEGMKQVYRDSLKQEFVGTFNVEKVMDTFGTTIVDYLFGSTLEPHGREFVVDNPAGRAYVKKQAKHPTLESRLMPKQFPFESDILIFGESIVMFAYDDEQTVVRIDNNNLADLLRAWFEMMWQG